MSISCSIIIPHYNQEKHLEECLKATYHQTADVSFDIIVVDNGTIAIDFQKYLDTYKGLRWISYKTKKNAYTLRNIGIRNTEADHILFLDAKCKPEKDWLYQMLAAAENVDIVAGRYRMTYASPDLKDKVHGLLYLNNDKNVGHNYGVTTGNLLVKRRVFDQIGLFDDGHVSGRDIQWSRKAQKHGINIHYSHNAVVQYPAHRWPDLIEKVKKYGRGAGLLETEEENGIRHFLPLKWETIQSAIQYRGLENLSFRAKFLLWYYASKIKWLYYSHKKKGDRE